jgi:hypothetical protein
VTSVLHGWPLSDQRCSRDLAFASYRAALALVSRAPDETMVKLVAACPRDSGLRSAPDRDFAGLGGLLPRLDGYERQSNFAMPLNRSSRSTILGVASSARRMRLALGRAACPTT